MSQIAFHLFVSASVFVVFCIHLCIAGTSETDRLALLHIKSQISDDPLGLLSSWNDSLSVCDWYGVSCGRKHTTRVTSLDLNSSKLTGTVSPYIGNLTFLSFLNLQNNSFGGTIPPEIGLLYRLQFLLLADNYFQGELPSNTSRCSQLIVLDVNNNKLFGVIPPELGSLLNLQLLVLSRNKFTGTIPASLGNLTYLSNLNLQINKLGGNIPSSLGRLENMEFLNLDTNNLYGVVPPSIFNLSALQKLTLGSNHFEGSLPSDLGDTLPNLQYFAINNNNFSGSIPASISNASNLVNLIMPSNKLQGQVPSLQGLPELDSLVLFDNQLGIGDPATDLEFVSSLANSTLLSRFVVGNNHFSGTFPRTFCNFSSLSVLTIGENNITGEIPSCIGNLAKLTSLDARENNLYGAIPESVGRLRNVFILYLGDNQLSGHIPSSLGNLTLLTTFILYSNNLQGHIPSTLGNCKNLLSLDLSSNNLSGGIPDQVLRLSSLSETLDVSNNHLTGPLSDDVGVLVNLRRLFVFDNLLTGGIPSTLGSCVELELLDMEGNFFQGVIPTALASLQSLKYLDLSRNNLSGKIPESLQGLPLKMLNLSYNNLQGEIPTSGVFSNASGFSALGNGGLCGGLSELGLHHCVSRSHGNKIKKALFFGIFGFILLVALVSIYTAFHRKRTKKQTGSSDLEKTLTNLSYQKLHQATNGFSSENLIGSGASGVVYKGTLEDVGTVIAIKIFNLEHHGASKSFVTECKALRNIRHRNLIKVITACSSLDCKGNQFKALVYDYMPNGSLEDWLHPRNEITNENLENVQGNLNMGQRVEIAVDVAFALEYLHHNCGTSVVHCDLKPSNVLLDKEMVAHVGDFGLAKFLSQGMSSSSATQSSSIGVRGTIGYAPPEYGMGNEVWMLGDVYSFGILVLEMFTGKRPTADMFRDGMSLREYVKAGLMEQDMEIVDHPLVQEMAVDDSDVAFEVLISVLEIGVTCCSELPRERPDMSEVVTKLCLIQTKLKGVDNDMR